MKNSFLSLILMLCVLQIQGRTIMGAVCRMSTDTTGDLLPFKYQPKKALAEPASAAPARITNPIAGSTPLLFEKTYLHTDRDVYAQGDTLWFKAYLVNGQDNKPASSSGNLYVELLAADSAKILEREIIRMEDGLGHGDMSLPDSLPAGIYSLRAYTNWMRNFGDNFVFEKNITLLDTKALPEASVSTGKSSSSNGTKQENNKKIKTATATFSPATNILPTVRFYPEGGSLVQGISAFVGVKAEDGYGNGISAKGAVLAASGDTVAHFTCDSLGIGLLAILPVAGQSYHAVVKLGTRQDIFQLPDALSKGLTLQIRQADTVIHALVHATGVSDSTISMVVKHAGKTVLSQRFNLKEGQVAFKISHKTLPEGISAITIYDNEGKPECERLVYIHHPDNKNKLSITTNKKNYQPKEQAGITIQTLPNSNLSMAVVDASIVPVQDGDIISYFNLQSELKGNIENPNRYFDTTNINRARQLDQLLLTQGWRDFVWRRLADTTIRISYAAENGISFSGKIWDEVRNKMLSGANISLHADRAKGIKLFSTRTDSAGRFHFDGLMLYGKQNIDLASIDDKGKDKGTILLDTLLPLKARPLPILGVKSSVDSMTDLAVQQRIETLKKSNFYKTIQLKEVSIKAKQNVVLNNQSVLSTWGPGQVFNITPKDYEYKTLEWFLLQNSKGAMKPNFDPNRLVSPIPPGPNRGVNQIEYKREMAEFMRPLTGVAYMGTDTFMVKAPSFNGGIYSYRSKTKPIPPNIIVNGRELAMDNYDQAEAYRIIYFNMPLNKFKKIELKHMIGTLHNDEPPIILPGYNGSPQSSVGGLAAQSQTIAVDRYLLYLTLNDNAMTDNPGVLSSTITAYYQARTFYQPLPSAKPSLNDYRTTIYWEPNIRTDAAGKATVSFYNAVTPTNIRIIVQGITDLGIPLASGTTYQVN